MASSQHTQYCIMHIHLHEWRRRILVISRETDYAIRILRALADEEAKSITQICTSEQIPRSFTYKIIEKLHATGMVECIRGRKGGCRLNVDLHEINLYDVMKAVDNECYLNLCLAPGHVCHWQETHMDACKVHPKLAKMQDEMNERLRSMNMYSIILE